MEPMCFVVINENIDSLNSATFIIMQHLIPIYPIQDLHILAGINVFYFSHAASWYKVFEYFRSRHQYVYYTFPYVVAIPFLIWTVNDFCLLSGNLCLKNRPMSEFNAGVPQDEQQHTCRIMFDVYYICQLGFTLFQRANGMNDNCIWKYYHLLTRTYIFRMMTKFYKIVIQDIIKMYRINYVQSGVFTLSGWDIMQYSMD